MYDVYFDGLPCLAEVKDLLNMLALLSALLLAVIAAYPTAIDSEELWAVSQQLGQCWYADKYEPELYFLKAFRDNYAWCIFSLGWTLVSSIILYVSMIGLNVEKLIDLDQKDGAQKKFEEWFRVSRWILIPMLLSLVSGTVLFFMSSYNLLLIKIPSLAGDMDECSAKEMDGYSYLKMIFVTVPIGSYGLTIMVASLAQYKAMTYGMKMEAPPV